MKEWGEAAHPLYKVKHAQQIRADKEKEAAKVKAMACAAEWGITIEDQGQ